MSSTFQRKREKINDKNKLTYVSNHNKYKLTKTMKVCFSSPQETKTNYRLFTRGTSKT